MKSTASTLRSGLRTGTSSVPARGARALFLGLAGLGALGTLGGPSLAQVPRVFVSTSDDVSPAAGLPFIATDGDLLAAGGGVPVRPYLAEGHFQATFGFVPGDVDAFARRPGSSPGRADSILFSLLSNEGGFLDGDVLQLDPSGGAALFVSELDLAVALGAPGANLDVDAISFDDGGHLLFSLQADLAGTSLGTVQDGDILRLESGFAGVTRILSEGDVQALFTQATGLVDAIGDVQALDWAAGAMWVAVQSPSAVDGAVIQLLGTPGVVLDEAAMGLNGAEVDALASLRSGDELPGLVLSQAEALPGDVVHVEAWGAPGSELMVLMAGGVGHIDFSRFPGFGSWFLDRADPWLNAILAAHAVTVAPLDGAGRLSLDFHAPVAGVSGPGWSGEQGWSYQVLDLSTLELSAPVRLRRL